MMPVELTDEQIIEIRKQASGGRFGRPATAPWGDTLKFARALLAAAQPATDNPAASHWHSLYRQAVQQKHDDAARLGAQIVGLEGELEALLKALQETQEALDVSQCPWCGVWGAGYSESGKPSAYCHHEYELRPWKAFATQPTETTQKGGA